MPANPTLDLAIANRFAASGDLLSAARVLDLALQQEPERAELRQRYEELLRALPAEEAGRVRAWDAHFENMRQPP